MEPLHLVPIRLWCSILLLMKDRVKTADQSEYKHDAELIDAKWTDGKYGKAVDINGKESTDFVITKEAATLKIAGQISKMAWVKAREWTGKLMTVIGKNNHNGGEHTSYGFGLTGQGAGIQAFFGTGGSRPTLNQPVKLDKNKWLHIAVTYDGTAIKSYLNGSLIAEKKEKFDFKGINDAPVRIGCAKDRPQYVFNGAIDEAVVFSRALTEKEIKEVMAGGFLAASPADKLTLTWAEVKSASLQ